MSDAPTIKALTETVGISQSYASMILSGARQPSRPLAIAIYRMTGWRHGLISDLTDEQISVLETVEPWAYPSAVARIVPVDEQRVIICSECDEPAPDPRRRACGNRDCPHALECAAPEPLADVELPPLTAKAPRRKKAA